MTLFKIKYGETSQESIFVFGIDRCAVYAGQINKYILHWYIIFRVRSRQVSLYVPSKKVYLLQFRNCDKIIPGKFLKFHSLHSEFTCCNSVLTTTVESIYILDKKCGDKEWKSNFIVSVAVHKKHEQRQKEKTVPSWYMSQFEHGEYYVFKTYWRWTSYRTILKLFWFFRSRR